MKFFSYFIATIFLSFLSFCGVNAQNFTLVKGGITRGDSTKKEIALVFTAHEFGDGAQVITQALDNQKIKASFFFTGDFYRNKQFKNAIQTLVKKKHYLGAHSDKHLLYCDWTKRDSLLVTKEELIADIKNNYAAMKPFGKKLLKNKFYIPPYEWNNDTISKWTEEIGYKIINFTPGTLSTADYTTPELKNYRDSETIYQSILNAEKNRYNGLNGYILLIHFGVDEKRTDKLYNKLEELLIYLKNKGYEFKKVNELLGNL